MYVCLKQLGAIPNVNGIVIGRLLLNQYPLICNFEKQFADYFLAETVTEAFKYL